MTREIPVTRPVQINRILSRPVRLLAAMACVAGGTLSMGAHASTTGLPALLAPASGEHHPGKMIFAELVTPNVADAERFYGGLFGWTFRDVPVQGTRYAEAVSGGAQVAGLIEKPIPADGRHRPAWLTFLSTGDVDATVRSATGVGARVLFAARDVPDLGREAVMADPQGAVFAVLASSSGDPGDTLAGDGMWIWSSLITRDPEAAATFYKAVFGFQVYNATDSTSGKHLVLAADNFARASVNSFPADRPDYRARWLSFLRVEDVGAAVGKVLRLGGRVLVPAHADRDGHPVSIVADPEGAAFGLLQWSGDQPDEDAR